MVRLNVKVMIFILLLLSVGHIIFDVYYSDSLASVEGDIVRENEIFVQGIQQGYEEAVIQLAQQVSTCEQVPLRIGNQSINVIAVGCLQ